MGQALSETGVGDTMPKGYIAIIRTFPRGRMETFVKGPFDSIKEAEIGATAYIQEGNNGYGGCGTYEIIESLASNERVHERGECYDGDKCGFVLLKPPTKPSRKTSNG